jgi:hypothetical protein
MKNIRLDSKKVEDNFTIFKRWNPTYHRKVVIILVRHILLLLFGFVTTTPNDVPMLQRRPINVNTHPEIYLYMPEVGEQEWRKMEKYNWSKCQFPAEMGSMHTNLHQFSTRPTCYFRVQAKGE